MAGGLSRTGCFAGPSDEVSRHHSRISGLTPYRSLKARCRCHPRLNGSGRWTCPLMKYSNPAGVRVMPGISAK